MTYIVLSMIVKNEAHVIERCLRQARDLVSSWCVVDTGSTDGTQELVRAAMKDLPGRLLEIPWVDQEHARNYALHSAMSTAPEGAYILTLDADDMLFTDGELELNADSHEVWIRIRDFEWRHPRLLRAATPWRWVGKSDPHVSCPGAVRGAPVDGTFILSIPDGGSYADPEKYRKKAERLRLQCEAEPRNARWRYYYAQALKDSGDLAGALDQYELRAAMGGWEEERWHALYVAAQLRAILGHDVDDVRRAYLHAYMARPTRAEPLVRLACYLRHNDDVHGALDAAEKAAAIPRPDDRLFVERSAYTWRALDELAMCRWACGDRDGAVRAVISAMKHAPEEQKERMRANLRAFKEEPCPTAL